MIHINDSTYAAILSNLGISLSDYAKLKITTLETNKKNANKISL